MNNLEVGEKKEPKKADRKMAKRWFCRPFVKKGVMSVFRNRRSRDLSNGFDPRDPLSPIVPSNKITVQALRKKKNMLG